MSSWIVDASRVISAVLLATALLGGCQRAPDQAAPAEAVADRLATLDEVSDDLGRFVEGERYRVVRGEADMYKGPTLPLVTIVEFSDLQCPFCSRLTNTLREVLDDHEQDVGLVFRHLPLPMHPEAKLAAQAVLAAHAQGRGWEMHDVAFDNAGALASDQLIGYAQQVGVADMPRFERELAEGAYAAQVEADMEDAARWHVSSTPVMFVNGRPLKGAVSEKKLRAVIEEELELAKRLMVKGAKRHEIYARIMRAAREERRTKPKPVADGRPDPAVNYAVSVDGRPSLGPADAPVTIVEFSDFQCPYCAKASDSVRELVSSRDDVRVVFRYLPLDMHQHAQAAARAVAAAERQGKFWEMHDKAFAAGASITEADFPKWARELELDMAKWKADFESDEVTERVAADAEIAERFGVTSTPSFFVNGRYMTGAQPVENFARVVDEEKAKALAFQSARNVAGEALYDQLITTFVDEVVGAKQPRQKLIADRTRRHIRTDGLPTKGGASPKVAIVECSDFDCPYCREAAGRLDELQKTYGDEIAVYWRHFPAQQHAQAEGAHKAAVAAGEQGKFWEMHDVLFADPSQRGDAAYLAAARQLGLDEARFVADLAAPATAARLRDDKDLCRRYGVRGTPGFLVNGRLINGIRSLEDFRTVIDEELAGGFEATARAARLSANTAG